MGDMMADDPGPKVIPAAAREGVLMFVRSNFGRTALNFCEWETVFACGLLMECSNTSHNTRNPPLKEAAEETAVARTRYAQSALVEILPNKHLL